MFIQFQSKRNVLLSKQRNGQSKRNVKGKFNLLICAFESIKKSVLHTELEGDAHDADGPVKLFKTNVN